MPFFADPSRDIDALRHAKLRGQVLAFFSIASCSFLLLALIWPISVSGFESRTRVSIRLNDKHLTQELFRVIDDTERHCLTAEKLAELIAVVNHFPGTTNSPSLPASENLLRQQTKIVAKRNSDLDLDLVFSFVGEGSPTEQSFVKNLSGEFCATLLHTLSKMESLASTQIEPAELAPSMEVIQKMELMVEKLEHQLDSAQGAIANLEQPATGPFHIASHRMKDVQTLDSVRQSVSAIDTSRLRYSLGRLKQNMQITAPHSLVALETNSTPPTRQQWTDSLAVTTEPIGSQPSSHQLILISLLSVALGIIVSQRFNPFASQGFSTLGQLSSAIDLPVAAAMCSEVSTEEISSGANSRIPPEATLNSNQWANRAVAGAQSILVGVTLIVIGFCVVDPDVRQAFLTNPFDGFSRLVWLFRGH